MLREIVIRLKSTISSKVILISLAFFIVSVILDYNQINSLLFDKRIANIGYLLSMTWLVTYTGLVYCYVVLLLKECFF